MHSVESVISKYLELRERKAQLAKKQAEEMAPLSQGMEALENWLLHRMNEVGTDNFKANGVGTAFRSTFNSCQLQDPIAFREFVFAPVVENIVTFLNNSGYSLRDADHQVIHNIVRDLPKWDMVDFRAGKKGVYEYVDQEKIPVPGVALNSVATVSIRKA